MFRYTVEVPFTDSIFVRMNYPEEMSERVLAVIFSMVTPRDEITEGISSYLVGMDTPQRLENRLRNRVKKGDFRLWNVRKIHS